MTAGTPSGAKTRASATVLAAAAIALGLADVGGAATAGAGPEAPPRYGVRPMLTAPVQRMEAVAHRRGNLPGADARALQAPPTAAAIGARPRHSSLSRRDAGATWFTAAAVLAAVGASIAVGARLLHVIRRRRRLAAAPTRSIGSPRTESREDRRKAGRPARADQPLPRLAAGEAVIGYVTASTDGGLGPDDGEAAIDAACARAGWDLIEIVRDRDQHSRSVERPGLSYALQKIAAGEARGLVVADLRRLCRSTVDLGTLVRSFHDARGVLIALDLDLDTSTPEGEHAARVLIAVGAWEQERIARRTRVGIADVKSRGGSVGRPAISDHPELRERITSMRASGMTLQAIADELNAEGVPTMRGGARWRPSSVQGALGYRRPSGPKDVERAPKNARSGSES